MYEVVKMIEQFIKRQNTNIRQLSIQTDIPYSTLRDLVVRKTDFQKCSVEIFRKLARQLHMSMEGLYTLFQVDQDLENAIMLSKEDWYVFQCKVLGSNIEKKLCPIDENGKMFVKDLFEWAKEDIFNEK